MFMFNWCETHSRNEFGFKKHKIYLITLIVSVNTFMPLYAD